MRTNCSNHNFASRLLQQVISFYFCFLISPSYTHVHTQFWLLVSFRLFQNINVTIVPFIQEQYTEETWTLYFLEGLLLLRVCHYRTTYGCWSNYPLIADITKVVVYGPSSFHSYRFNRCWISRLVWFENMLQLIVEV